MVKQDEKDFLALIVFLFDADGRPHWETGPTVRDIINTPGCPVGRKRAWYLLDKWAGRDWYEYGVNIELGWLLPKGIEQAYKWTLEQAEAVRP